MNAQSIAGDLRVAEVVFLNGPTHMPCYLFTFHAYGSWMPDHPRGYVRRHEGVLAPEPHVATQYREAMTFVAVEFAEVQQLAAIRATEVAVAHLHCRLYFVATDPTHFHLLVSWQNGRSWQQTRNSLKRSITIALKNQFGNRPWLCEGSSRKRVREAEHFEYLMTRYLPKHRGWKWCERRGLFK